MSRPDILDDVLAAGGRLHFDGRLRLTMPESAPALDLAQLDWLRELKQAAAGLAEQADVRTAHLTALTYSARAIVRATSMEPDSTRFNVLFYGLVSPEFDGERLLSMLRRLPTLAPGLFFRFGWAGAIPFQLGPVADPHWLQTRFGEPTGPEQARVLADGLARRPFDLDTEPGVRAQVCALFDGRHSLALVVHHAVCDLNTFGSVMKRLAHAATDGPANGNSPDEGPRVADDVVLANRAALLDAGAKRERWTQRLQQHPDCLLTEFMRADDPREMRRECHLSPAERNAWRQAAGRMDTTSFGLACSVLADGLLLLSERSAVLFSVVSDGLAVSQRPPAGGSFADIAAVLATRPPASSPSLSSLARDIAGSLADRLPSVHLRSQIRTQLRSVVAELMPVNLVWHQQTRAQRGAMQRLFTQVDALCEQVGPVAPIVIEITDDGQSLRICARITVAESCQPLAQHLIDLFLQQVRALSQPHSS